MGLHAQVRTRDGWPVEHAVVTVTDGSGGQVLRVAADGDGVARAEGALAPGPYTVVVTALGYAPDARTALVGGTGRADVGTVVLARAGGTELPPPGMWTVDAAHSSVGAVAQHLGLSSVHGRFTEFTGRIEIAPDVLASRVEAVVAAGSVDTGNTLRDKHLRSEDFLDVDRFPELTYRSTAPLRAGGPDRWTVDGELTLRGVTRQVPLDLTYLGTGADPWGGVRAAFRAEAELRRDDFAMNYNQVVSAGIAAIGATLRVTLDIQAVRED
ncbi:YceI family protein [Streptomyces sp. NPDC046332]|uniref:YceI family protein n=1 Tax=unclassified Streptomyces TaxID=2593676 RepID=UPI0033E9B09C